MLGRFRAVNALSARQGLIDPKLPGVDTTGRRGGGADHAIVIMECCIFIRFCI